jgi:hypothetical protein
MTYYRIAGRLRVVPAPPWRWRTTKLDSLQAVWAHLQHYRWSEHTELRVFIASSVDLLEAMLARANTGKLSTSLAAEDITPGLPLPGWMPGAAEGADEPEEPAQEDVHPGVESARPHEQRGSLDPLDWRRLELEVGAGGDHDLRYTFAFPRSLPQSLAWVRLRASVECGERAP